MILAYYILSLKITTVDIRPYVTRAVNLLIAYGHFDVPQVFVWACMPGRYGYIHAHVK